MARGKGRQTWGTVLTAIGVAAIHVTALAQSAGPDQSISLSIAAQRMSDALRRFAEAAGLQLVYDTKITDGKTSTAVSGPLTSRAALTKLLAGSGLSFQFLGDRTVVITAVAGDGIRSVGVVSVEGVTGRMPFGEMVSPVNGVNGSRDVEATEGTGSYTTGANVGRHENAAVDTPDASVRQRHHLPANTRSEFEQHQGHFPGNAGHHDHARY